MLVVSLVVHGSPFDDPRHSLDWYKVASTEHVSAWISPKSTLILDSLTKTFEAIAAIHNKDGTQDHFLVTVNCRKKIVEPAKAKWAADEYLKFMCD